MNRFKILLSGLFFIYLILDGFTKNSMSFYIAIPLVIGIVLDWYLTHREQKVTNKEEVIGEDCIIEPLSNLMEMNSLEMRLSRADPQWNVTFTRKEETVVHIVGRGSAPSIAEAIMRAEDDFEKRSRNDAS